MNSGVIELLNKYKPLYCLFSLISMELYFNENIYYSHIHKKWITIHKNKLIWDHRYAELKYVLNNITLCSRQSIKPPLYIYSQSTLNELISPDASKYEIFTSTIVNNVYQKNKHITKMKVMHCKNTRNDSKDDLPLFSIQSINSHRENPTIYKMINSKEVTDIANFIIDYDIHTYSIGFTDWRDLYRSGYSLSDSNFLMNDKKIQTMLHHMNVYSIFAIVTDGKNLYSVDLLHHRTNCI